MAGVAGIDGLYCCGCSTTGAKAVIPLSAATPHIFICFSSKDESTAREVVEFLELEGIKCWISLRDVPAGQNYQENIVQAIEAAAGMVFLFSSNSNASGEVKKELSLAGSFDKPVFPLRLLPVTPNAALRYELAIRQWIDVFPDKQRALRTLAETIKKAAASSALGERDSPRVVPIVAPDAQTVPIVASGTQEFDAIRTLLARHIGPIAKVLVEKAASQTRTPDEFCERLAAHVATGPERLSFMQAVRARLMVKS
jgi:TIR domain